ncbi:MAG TPA: hypothetical protein DEF45_13325 [Rhodopirellula sp.]|nr:hypothetical protein [Rhodopirellula sp.]
MLGKLTCPECKFVELGHRKLRNRRALAYTAGLVGWSEQGLSDLMQAMSLWLDGERCSFSNSVSAILELAGLQENLNIADLRNGQR